MVAPRFEFGNEAGTGTGTGTGALLDAGAGQCSSNQVVQLQCMFAMNLCRYSLIAKTLPEGQFAADS